MNKRKLNRPSDRKIIALTIAATFIALGLFAGFFATSYIFVPANNTSSNNGKNNIDFPYAISNNSSTQGRGMANINHAHAILMVFINGRLLNFSTPNFQKKDLLMHFENGNGFILHKHDSTAWLGPFFESLNITFAKNCFVILSDKGQQTYCTNFENQIMFFVNGTPNYQFEHYTPKDGDRILISYGSRNSIDSQLLRLKEIKIPSYGEEE